MKRSELFLERVLLAVLYLVPYVIMEFADGLHWGSGGSYSLNLMGMAVRMLVLHLLIYLLVYFSSSAGIITVTGNMLMGILCLGGMYLYGIVLELMLQVSGHLFLDTLLRGNTSMESGISFADGSPRMVIVSLTDDTAAGSSGKYLAAVVILTCLSWQSFPG